MKILVKLILFFCIFTQAASAELVKPQAKLKPIEVLTIQLKSLKNNNMPYKDAGIEQTWEFAHPANKRITGPLDKFKQMIYSESYEILIDHESSEITVLQETDNLSIYKVIITSKSKRKYFYIWQVEKVLIDGNLKNCWMTTSVSNPNYIGEII
tara:strand:- start:495 stop:956 length:462 start_codon:yes stop_codon:yes gene_type:complete